MRSARWGSPVWQSIGSPALRANRLRAAPGRTESRQPAFSVAPPALLRMRLPEPGPTGRGSKTPQAISDPAPRMQSPTPGSSLRFRCATNSRNVQSSQHTNLVVEHRPLGLIIVLSAGDPNLRRRQIQLGLAHFDDRAESEVVTALRQVQSELGLIQQLSGEAYALERGLGV